VSDPWLIVGLGNPEPRYARNRHNVGRMVIDILAGRAGARLGGHRTRARLAEARLGVMPGGAPGPRVILAEPASYMNLSGGPVKALVGFYRVDPTARLLVIHDELDLPLGTVRIKRGGNENGHNGLKSATAELGSRDYLRVRVGISRPPQGTPVVDYVLSALPEGPDTDDALARAAQAVTLITTKGVSAAQNQIH